MGVVYKSTGVVYKSMGVAYKYMEAKYVYELLIGLGSRICL